MLRKAASPLDQNSGSQLQALQKKAIHEVTYELIRQVTSPNDLLRNHVCILLCIAYIYLNIIHFNFLLNNWFIVHAFIGCDSICSRNHCNSSYGTA